MSWVSQMEKSDQESDQVTKNMNRAALIRPKFRRRRPRTGTAAAGLGAAGLWTVMGAPSRWAPYRVLGRCLTPGGGPVRPSSIPNTC
ncbi:hypothetical protein MTP06_53790 [Streptomyces sp. PLM4]|uniref:Uncharacterized protein n=1 Tax=Streptomyces albidoflavus TaxID=1886 RepID=A0AA37FAI0_9ACTN|nr:hypothetical protein MTP02_06450 [Streptomyces albus]BDH71930.1 hypothetical protein MTP06_53790 [Streptomyces sp. PLM4]GHI44661.1 hypothetical protein ScoT_08350 [Streptomyces albidoflavus]